MSRPRILIIEDERGLTQALEYNLQREGYDVAVAHDGQEGLRKAQTLLPDVIETVRGVGYRFKEAATEVV
jgi:two-component system phosphate regulon response regulator PhoB